MHFLRLATFGLGAWLIASPLVMLVTLENTRSIGGVIEEKSESVQKLMLKINQNEAGSLLRHHASLVNQELVQGWEIAQLVLGAVILMAMFFGSNAKRYAGVICLLMMICAGFQHWTFSAEMRRLSPVVDFQPPDQISTQRDRLQSLESGYLTIEGVKMLLGIAVSVSLMRRRRRRSASAEID